MSLIALIIGKISLFFLTIFGKGSSFPGKLAFELDNEILSHFDFPDTVILVTGTNGKTSTTHYLADIFEEADYRIMTNLAGANMVQGIVTQALKHSKLNFKIDVDAVILEVDEGSLKHIIDSVDVSHLVLLNLFPDQEDRFGSVEQLTQDISQLINDDSILILNGNDPRVLKIGLDHPTAEKFYFGLDDIELDHLHHAITCPNCQASLFYDKHYYEHLGRVECYQCGLKTPNLDYMAHQIKIDDQTFMEKDASYYLPQANAYSLYNSLAAISVARIFAIHPDQINNALKKGHRIKGRNDKIKLEGKEIHVNMAKNPAGMNQSLTFIKNQKSDSYQLLLAINNKKADGTSINWLEDCAFEILNDTKLTALYITGDVSHQLKDILMSKGIPHDKIQLFEEKTKAIQTFSKESNPSFMIANYTALYEIYDDLNK